MICPQCGKDSVVCNVMQEDRGSKTKSVSKSKYKEKGHGFLWWIFIGWWWWIIDLFSWIFFFFPRLILRLFAAPFKKKKYTSKTVATSTTRNDIRYTKVCICQNCGHSWKENA